MQSSSGGRISKPRLGLPSLQAAANTNVPEQATPVAQKPPAKQDDPAATPTPNLAQIVEAAQLYKELKPHTRWCKFEHFDERGFVIMRLADGQAVFGHARDLRVVNGDMQVNKYFERLHPSDFCEKTMMRCIVGPGKREGQLAAIAWLVRTR
jgi:hypothetical protein